jgi:amino-acid N-acetyltransferase
MVMNERNNNEFPIEWLRHTSPYINSHRGSTFVIWVSGTLLQDKNFANLVHDLTLLCHLGVRLVLVHGMRPQIDAELRARGLEPRFGQPLQMNLSANEYTVRITDNDALPALQSALATIRSTIESAFSTGLPNTPMSGSQVTLCSGNFVVARPFGIRDGIDYCHTGEVRRIRNRQIEHILDKDMVVLLSPIGYSPTGEQFNLHSEDVATRTAIDLRADKLVFLHEDAPYSGNREEAQSERNPGLATSHNGREISASADMTDYSLPAALKPLQQVVDNSIYACRNGVPRCHIVSTGNGALMEELFTRDGSGLLVYSGGYDTIRQASTRDVSGIMALVRPLIDQRILVHRSEQDLERHINDFYVAERDGSVIACASLTVYDEQAELGCLAVHPDFRASGKAAEMLQHLTRLARQAQCNTLFALTTRSGDWFREQGFEPDTLDNLPASRLLQHDANARGSKMFSRTLT